MSQHADYKNYDMTPFLTPQNVPLANPTSCISKSKQLYVCEGRGSLTISSIKR